MTQAIFIETAKAEAIAADGKRRRLNYRIAFYMKLKLYDIFKINKGQTLFI